VHAGNRRNSDKRLRDLAVTMPIETSEQWNAENARSVRQLDEIAKLAEAIGNDAKLLIQARPLVASPRSASQACMYWYQSANVERALQSLRCINRLTQRLWAEARVNQ